MMAEFIIRLLYPMSTAASHLHVGDRRMYRTSLGITTNMSLSASMWVADNAKSLGVDGIWVGEDIGRGHEVFALTTAMILRARGVRVGTAIVPVAVHEITSLARAARTLSELAEGQFVLGIGIGGMQDVHSIGIRIQKPVACLQETVKTLRKLWAGEAVTTECELFGLQDYSLGLKRPVRLQVFLGVRGPQMLKLAGHVADGVILSGPTAYLEYAINIITDEAARAGRNPESIERVIWVPTIPTFKGGDPATAKRVIALVVADTPNQVIGLTGVDKEQVELIRASVRDGGPSEGAAHVTEDIIDTFAVRGSLEQMVDQFDAIARLGASEIVVGPPFSGDWRAAVIDLVREIAVRKTDKT
jgi:5,10-methylenetetrahydromethanopterin reductase